MAVTLEQVQKAIKSQGLIWEAGKTPIGSQLARGTFQGLGLSIRREPGGGRRFRLPAQSFAFTAKKPPEEVDWRQVNGLDWTTSVRDQKNCNSCVAFATNATIESRVKILKKDSYLNLMLSVADLFCVAGDDACDEGWQIGNALDRCRKHGVGLEKDFPYRPVQQKCINIKTVAKVLRWLRINQTPERREAIYKRGPVIAGMVVYSDLGYYKAGVYRPTTSEIIGLHAICVVGYDDEKGCWIIKNSWGAAWGEGGFARIGYGSCGIDSQFPFYDPVVEYSGA